MVLDSVASILIISDNAYFCIGANAILSSNEWQKKGCNRHVYSLNVHGIPFGKFAELSYDAFKNKYYETVVINVNTPCQRREILKSMEQFNASRIIVFAPSNFFRGERAKVNYSPRLVPANTSVMDFMYCTLNNSQGHEKAIRVDINEKKLVSLLCKGDSINDIAKNLKKNEKHIYNLKLRMMRKVGIGGVHGLMLYRDIIGLITN